VSHTAPYFARQSELGAIQDRGTTMTTRESGFIRILSLSKDG